MKQLLRIVSIGVLTLSLGLCGCAAGAFASVGDIKLVSAGHQYAPLQNFLCSCNKDGLYADGMRKQPQDVAKELDAVPVAHDARIVMNGKTARSPGYTLYDEQLQKIYEDQEEFVMPEEPGKYILCVGVTWGTEKVYEAFQYFFMIERNSTNQ